MSRPAHRRPAPSSPWPRPDVGAGSFVGTGRPLTTRRGALAMMGAGALLPLLRPATLLAQPRSGLDLDQARQVAIRQGCAYIAGEQRRDGGFGDDKAVVALTALSVLALMSEGSIDGRGRYGDAIRRGLDFLVGLVVEPRSDAWAEGYFYHPADNNSRMHGQGYATLALATALGTSTDRRFREIRDVLGKAVACIEQAQTPTGGFGYNPVPDQDHEGSVTVTVAQGLRAARDAGLLVDQDVVKRGLRYLKRSQKQDGSFQYSLHVTRSSYALTAAALSSFYLYGSYRDDPDRTIERGFRFLMDNVDDVIRRRQWYYYGNFYAAWACWQRDGDQVDPRSGGTWARWHRRIYPHLLQQQRKSDGSWEDAEDRFNFGALLPTTFAVLTLAIPDEPLPIFQR